MTGFTTAKKTPLQIKEEKIAQESLAESLSLLSSVSLYFLYIEPGHEDAIFSSGGSFFPLSPEVGRTHAKHILYNPRYAKVLHELSLLPRMKAARLINNEFETAIASYNEIFAEYAAADAEKTNTAFVIGTEDETEILPLGARYKVLSLVWLAGTLQLRECRSMVEEVVRKAVEQKEFLYGNQALQEMYRRVIAGHLSLYNRQILAYALAETADDAGAVRQFMAGHDIETLAMRLGPFFAVPSSYLLPDGDFYAEPGLVRSPGHVYCVKAIDDDTFDKLVQLCAPSLGKAASVAPQKSP